MLQTELSKRGVTLGKRAEIKIPYLSAKVHISICSHIEFQANPYNGLGGVAITMLFYRGLKRRATQALNPSRKNCYLRTASFLLLSP